MIYDNIENSFYRIRNIGQLSLTKSNIKIISNIIDIYNG